MYRSFVISVFVFMESQITSLCNHIEDYSSQVFSHKDLAGNGIGRSIKYLEKVLGKNFPNSLYLKPRFEIAQKIRNALVHNYGVIKDNDISQIKAFIKQNPDILELSKDGEVYVTYKYAEAMLYLNKDICKEVSKNWKIKAK